MFGYFIAWIASGAGNESNLLWCIDDEDTEQSFVGVVFAGDCSEGVDLFICSLKMRLGMAYLQSDSIQL